MASRHQRLKIRLIFYPELVDHYMEHYGNCLFCALLNTFSRPAYIKNFRKNKIFIDILLYAKLYCLMLTLFSYTSLTYHK